MNEVSVQCWLCDQVVFGGFVLVQHMSFESTCTTEDDVDVPCSIGDIGERVVLVPPLHSSFRVWCRISHRYWAARVTLRHSYKRKLASDLIPDFGTFLDLGLLLARHNSRDSLSPMMHCCARFPEFTVVTYSTHSVPNCVSREQIAYLLIRQLVIRAVAV